MSTWKRKAIEAAPEIRQTLEMVPNPMSAWIELRPVFERYVHAGDTVGIKRIMAYHAGDTAVTGIAAAAQRAHAGLAPAHKQKR